ncbi:hypothetical protein C0995_005502 [Termitomyces sp. Mi166|nr:hypothetical protein C0995_005502 [Termitomyces sp. Mi166\
MPTLSPTDHTAPIVSIDRAGLPSKIEAFNASVPLKKKKKRRREEEGTEGTTGEVVRKRKKKKKRHTEEGTGATLQVDEAPVGEVQPVEQQGERDKGTSSQAIEPQIDPALETPEARDAAAALISAIAAATSGSRDSGTSDRAQPSQPEPQYDHALAHQNHPQESLHFPFMPYGYGQSPFIPVSLPVTESSLFPTGANLPLSELNFGSNEDVLRALQALDMSKITSVLRNIGEGPAGVDDSTMGRPPTPSVQAPPQHLPVPPMPTPMLPMGQGQVPIPNHRHALGLPTPTVEQQGRLIYKKGKFSAFEEEQLEDAIEKFRIPFMTLNKLASAVPLRPIIAVYHHVRRTHHPLKKQGVWNADEDADLEKAVIEHGQQWEKISPIVGRMPSDCRDRYRNHIVNKNIRVFGHWSKEEEDQLTRIVTDMTVNQGRDIDSDVFWGRVSELMGGKRGRQQCRIKWTDALCKTVKTGGQKTRWSPQDAYILIHKLVALNVRDDTEIDWKLLPDPVWNLWSPHTLQRRWLTMKRGIKGWEDMTHQEIMDILRARKAHLLPPPPPRKKRERRILSAITVIEEALAQFPDGVPSEPAIAGPSSEPPAVGSSAGLAEDDDVTSSSSDSEE